MTPAFSRVVLCTFALALGATSGGCVDGAQPVARRGDGGAACSWQGTQRPHQLPIRPVNGEPAAFAVSFDAPRSELLFVYKADPRPRSTQTLLRRYHAWGTALDPPLQLQAELPWTGFATRWDHRLAGLIATGAGHLAVWSQRVSPAAGEVRSELWIQRIAVGSPLGTPQKLLDLPSHLDARDLIHAGGQLIVASVEDATTTSPSIIEMPKVTLRRFDENFTAVGAPIEVPLTNADAPLTQVLDLKIAGDGAHLGVLSTELSAASAQRYLRFTLFRDGRVVATARTAATDAQSFPPAALAYGDGHFLRCSGAVASCALVADDAPDATGAPIPLVSAGAEAIRGAWYFAGHFWLAASSGAGQPALRAVGWGDAAGNWSLQPIWRDASEAIELLPLRVALLPTGADEITWIDNFTNQGATREQSALLHLQRTCP